MGERGGRRDCKMRLQDTHTGVINVCANICFGLECTRARHPGSFHAIARTVSAVLYCICTTKPQLHRHLHPRFIVVKCLHVTRPLCAHPRTAKFPPAVDCCIVCLPPHFKDIPNIYSAPPARKPICALSMRNSMWKLKRPFNVFTQNRKKLGLALRGGIH